LAAEREARIVKRSVAKANAKSDALRQRKEITKFGYISEEEDELYENPQLSPPLPPPRPTKHSSRKTSRSSISQKIDSNTRLASTRDALRSSLCPGDASSSYHAKQNPIKINYPEEEEPMLGSYSNHHLSSDPHPEPLQEDIYISPPRTPPPNSHLNPTKKLSPMRNSPGQLFDFGNVLSPSFLNGSPNSLLRRLNSQKHLIDTSTDASNLSGSYLSNFPSAAMPDKVFSPSRFLGSSNKSKPLPPVAEPSKKVEKSSPNPLLVGSVGLLDAHLNLGSSSSGKSQNNKHFIFSPSRSVLPKLKENQSIHSRKSKSIKASSSHETLNPMIPGPSKSRRVKKTAIESAAYRESLPAHLIPVSRTTSDSSLLAPPCPTSGPSWKKTDHPSQQQSSKPVKQTMARTIWCRRLETTATATTTHTNGISSEDSQIEEHFGQRIRGPSPLESRPSSEGVDFRSRNQARVGFVGGAEESGLSSAMFRGLPADLRTSMSVERGIGLGSGLGHSDSQLMAASSPPVLPPPSDCSEGITPLSAEPASDEPDHHHHQLQSDFGKTGRLNRTTAELRLGSGPALEEQDDLPGRSTIEFDLMAGEPAAGALADITDALNRHLRPSPLPHHPHHRHPDSSSALDPSSAHSKLDSLSPEIIAALSQAINAGLSASEIAQALRTLDDPPLPPGPSTSSLPNHFSYQPVHHPQHQHSMTTMTTPTPTAMMASSSLLNQNLIDPSLDDHPFASFLETHSLLNNTDNDFITNTHTSNNTNTNNAHPTNSNQNNSNDFTRLQPLHPLIPSSTTTTTTTNTATNDDESNFFSSFLIDNHDFFSGGGGGQQAPPSTSNHFLEDHLLQDQDRDFVLSLQDIDGLLGVGGSSNNVDASLVGSNTLGVNGTLVNRNQ
jgi:hypothetical protein